MRCRGGDSPARRNAADPNRLLIKRGWPRICHCEGALRPWQSREGSYDFAESTLLSGCVPRDCTPRALPRASRSGRHVGLRPPRNDKSGAGTVLTIACANRRFTAGRGMPLPYNAPSTAGSYIEPYTQRSMSFPLF